MNSFTKSSASNEKGRFQHAGARLIKALNRNVTWQAEVAPVTEVSPLAVGAAPQPRPTAVRGIAENLLRGGPK